jgi:hypothetical protein
MHDMYIVTTYCVIAEVSAAYGYENDMWALVSTVVC